MRHLYTYVMRTAILFCVACAVHARTASEVYEQAAMSTVVVINIGNKGTVNSTGSGVVLAGGHVVTSCHVIEDSSQIKVRMDDKEHPATLQYSDPERDVCSLNITGLNAPAAVIGTTKTLKVGAKVYAIGAPKGLELTLSDGLVSSLREADGGHYIQTTAAISPGSSGGGLFDENGALVGLISFFLADGQNLNFAIPVEWVQELAKRSTETSASDQPVNQWLNRAIELENRKDWLAMLEHDRRWTKAQPGKDMAWYSLGIAYSKVDQPAKTIEAYQQALRINPEHAEAWFNLGCTYSKTGQSADTIEAYQQSLRINPDDAEAWSNLGIAYAGSGQREKVLAVYKQLKTLDAVIAERFFSNILIP